MDGGSANEAQYWYSGIGQKQREQQLTHSLNRHLAQHLHSSSPKRRPPTPKGTWGNFGETRGGVGKSGVLEHKSGNISETRKDRGNVTMEGL